MENIQQAIFSLQAALQKRPSCDASTQTDYVPEDSNISQMKYHIQNAYKYMTLQRGAYMSPISPEYSPILPRDSGSPDPNNIFNSKVAVASKGFKRAHSTCSSLDKWIKENNSLIKQNDAVVDDDLSESDYESDGTARNDLFDIIDGAAAYKCNKCGISCCDVEVEKVFGWKKEKNKDGKRHKQSWCRSCREKSRPATNKRKKRKRESGAKDDESFIMERHNRVYLAYKPENRNWQMKCVLKSNDESWDDADNSIMRKMKEVQVNGKTSENSLTEREKLVQLWSEQCGVSYTVGQERAKTMTNLELFVAIKKQSPGLVKSGIPIQ